MKILNNNIPILNIKRMNNLRKKGGYGASLKMKLYITDNISTMKDLAQLLKLDYQPAMNAFIGDNNSILYINSNYDIHIKGIGRRLIKINDGLEDITVTVEYKNYADIRNFKNLLEKNNIEEIINICDSNSKGQLNFEIFMVCCGADTSNAKRIWLQDSTINHDDLRNPKADKDFHSESKAKLAELILEKYWHYRSKDLFDEYIEINLNELFLLNQVYNKEKEIESSDDPSNYFKIEIDISGYKFKWQGKRKREKIPNIKEAMTIANELKNKTLMINTININEGEREHPMLFNSTDLFKAIQSSKIASLSDGQAAIEKLYNEGYITNPATESRHLPISMKDKLIPILSKLKEVPYFKGYIDYIKTNETVKITKRVINEDYVDSNHAIIPTEKVPINYNLTQEEFNIYDLIVRRFLSVFLGSTKTTTVTLTGYIDNDNSAKYEKTYINYLGWQIMKDSNIDIYEEIEMLKNKSKQFTVPETEIFEFGNEYKIEKVSVEPGNPRGKTRYTVASLITLMANCGKNIKSDKVKVKLRHQSIGMPEDRGTIVETMLKKEYISLKDDKIYITEKGKSIIEKAPKDLLTNQLLEAFNTKIKAIQQNRVQLQDVIREHTSYVTKIIESQENAKNAIELINYSNITENYSCPYCNSKLADKGNFIGCTGYPNCKFTIPKEMYQYNLNETDIKQLIENGVTDLITGFTFKKGPVRGGKAKLTLNENRKVVLKFND